MNRILYWALLACILGGCQRRVEPEADPDMVTWQPEPPPVPPTTEEPTQPAILQEAEPEIPSVETVKEMLRKTMKGCGFDNTSREEAALMVLGDRVFPAYEAILADPRSEYWQFSTTCFFILKLQTDRRQFIPPLVRRLAPDGLVSPDVVLRATIIRHSRWSSVNEPVALVKIVADYAATLPSDRGSTRACAVWLIGEIGDEREAVLLRPLLSDNDRSMRNAAADALAKIGMKQDLDAMDAWLKADDPRKDANEQLHFQKRRDQLEKRLKDHPVPKHLIN